jgi:hypothetical protein
MGFKIREIQADAKLTDQGLLEAIETTISHPLVEEIVKDHGLTRQRQRKLSAVLGVILAVAMNLWAKQSLSRVLIKLMKGLRFIWPDPTVGLASKGAISQLRYQIGAAPVVDLFHRVCKPMASPDTPGAFLFGLRMMAVDGTVEEVADTLENEAAFGRLEFQRGPSAFPQVRCSYLMEVGTHAIVDAGFWPIHTGERVGAFRMLRSVQAGMLLMWDRGLHSFDMARNTQQKGAHFLARVPDHVLLKPIQHLPDGSYLALLQPSEYHRRKAGEYLLVRVIEYTIDDPALPGYGQRHRLMTSLLDHKTAPAIDLARAYHERWEIELCIDEIDTHQRLATQPLRSKKPVGVIQELYGLLIAHYAVRKVMLDAATEVGLDPERMSFINALELVCDAIPEFQMTDSQAHPQLYQRLLQDIRRFQLPERDNRWNPRVVKRKMSKFPLKRPESYHPARLNKPFREAVVLLN